MMQKRYVSQKREFKEPNHGVTVRVSIELQKPRLGSQIVLGYRQGRESLVYLHMDQTYVRKKLAQVSEAYR